MKRILVFIALFLLTFTSAYATDVKISALPDGSSAVSTADTIPIVQGTTTKRTTLGYVNVITPTIDAIWVYGSGTDYNDTTMMSACTAVGSDYKTILLRYGTWTVTANKDFATTCPNAVFKLENGAVITHTSYTIAVPRIEAGDYQIFNGTGAITFNDATVVSSAWFGSGSTGLHKALDASLKTIKIPAGSYEDAVIDKDDITLIVDENVVFKTSDAGKTPAIKFNGVDRVEVKGRIVANGNASNNSHSYTATDLGYAYGTVAFYNSTYLSVGDIYVYDAWDDGVVLDTVSFSSFKTITAKDAVMRGLVIYQDCVDNSIDHVIVTGSGTDQAVRIGGSSGKLAYRNTIGSIIAKTVTDGVDIERYASKIDIGTIIADTVSAGNGLKINDANNITVGNIQAHTIGYNGVLITSTAAGTSNVNIANIIVVDAGEASGTYNGLYIYAGSSQTTEGINIGQVTAKSCGTSAGNGVYVLTDGSSTIQDISIKSIIANSNYVYGVLVEDAGTVQRINLGNVTASGNSTGDFRVEYGVKQVAWGNLVVASANNEIATSNLVGNRMVIATSAAPVSTSGTGEDTLRSTTVGAGVMGATSVLHIVAAGQKTNSAGNQKTLKFYFGATSVTFVSLNTDAGDWRFEAYIYNTAADAQVWIANCLNATDITYMNVVASAIDTSSAVTVKVTGEVGNTGADAITQSIWLVERL